jgi:phenylacetate-CoA ligase
VQRRLEKVFRAPSLNSYGGRELSLIAIECAEQVGLHEVSENNYVEYEAIPDAGVEDLSDLLLTNLNNHVMPFLRYRIGDMGVPSTRTTCACGRGAPLIGRVVGRTTDMFVFPDGTRTTGIMFMHVMKDLGLRRYQFVQTAPEAISLRILPEDAAREGLEERIRTAYRPYLPPGVTLSIRADEEMAKTRSGKFRFVYRDMGPKAPE